MSEKLSLEEFERLTTRLYRLEKLLEDCNHFNDPEIENYKILINEEMAEIKKRLKIEDNN